MHRQDRQIQIHYKLIQQNVQLTDKMPRELKLHIPTEK